MSDKKPNKDQGLSKQTVWLPEDLMEHYDQIKRKRGHRSIGSYIVELIRRDKESLTSEAPLIVLTDPELSSSIQPELDMLEDVVTHARRVADTADRVRKQLLGRAGSVPTQGTGEGASEKTRGKRSGKRKAS